MHVLICSEGHAGERKEPRARQIPVLPANRVREAKAPCVSTPAPTPTPRVSGLSPLPCCGRTYRPVCRFQLGIAVGHLFYFLEFVYPEVAAIRGWKWKQVCVRVCMCVCVCLRAEITGYFGRPMFFSQTVSPLPWTKEGVGVGVTVRPWPCVAGTASPQPPPRREPQPDHSHPFRVRLSSSPSVLLSLVMLPFVHVHARRSSCAPRGSCSSSAARYRWSAMECRPW